MILRYVKCFFTCNRAKVEVICHPSESYQCWARNSWDTEEYKFRIMPCAIANPAVREGFFVSVYLRNPIDEWKCDIDANHSNFKEDRRFELSSKHYYCSFYINQWPINTSVRHLHKLFYRERKKKYKCFFEIWSMLRLNLLGGNDQILK